MTQQAETGSSLIKNAVDKFWHNSTKFYSLNEVSSYLLELQNSQNKNINELLFSLWFSDEYSSVLSPETVQRGLKKARRTKKWVANIRETRFELEQQWQPPYPEKIKSARDAILETEIKIEKIHQQKLVEGVLTSDGFVDQGKNETVDEKLTLENLTRLCDEAQSETDYLQLVMLWQGFKNSISAS